MGAAAEVNELARRVERAASEVDRALDRADRKAFRLWCKRRTAALARLADLLVRIATR